MKRVFSVVLAILMCVSMIPAQAFAEEPVPEETALEDAGVVAEPAEPVHEHVYEAIVTAPTCTEQGYTTYVCACGDSYVGDYVDAAGHVPEAVTEIPAAIGQPGQTAGTICAVCGEVLEGCEEIPALEAEEPVHEHAYEAVVTVPTCTEQGYTTYVCACGDSYVADYVNAAGHVPEAVTEVPATETEPGRAAGTICAVCGEVLEGCEEIPTLGKASITIDNQPEDTEPTDGMVIFSVAASADAEGELQYQWQRLNETIEYPTAEEREASWEDILDETGMELRLMGLDDEAALQEGMQYAYRCVVCLNEITAITDEVKIMLPVLAAEVSESVSREVKNSATENSIGAIIPTGYELSNHSADISVKLSVTPETAAAGYYYGAIVNTSLDFNNSDTVQIGPGNQYGTREYNEETVYVSTWNDLVPGVTYYLMVSLKDSNWEPLSENETVTFTTPDNRDGMDALVLDSAYYTPDYYSRFYSYYTAEEDGFYIISTGDDFSGDGSVWGSDGNRISWLSNDNGKTVVQLSGGDTVYVYGISYSTGSITVSKSTPATEDSIEAMVPAGENLSNHEAGISVKLSVTPETAAAGYLYGAELSTSPDFNDILWSSNYDSKKAFHSEEIFLSSFDGLVPGVTYYLRGVIWEQNWNQRAVSDVVSFTAVNSLDGMEALTMGSNTIPLAGYYYRYYTASEGGYYEITASVVQYAQVYSSAGKDLGRVESYGNEKVIVGLNAGETVYIYGYGYGNASVTISTYEVATENSIEVLAPTGDDLSNHSASLKVKLSVTPETAAAGYYYRTERSTSPDFDAGQNNSGTSYGNKAYNGEIVSAEWYSELVPGVTYYVRATLKDDRGTELAVSDTVSFTTPDNLDGIEALAIGSNTFPWGGQYYRYFTASEGGYYEFIVEGIAGQLYNAAGKEIGHVDSSVEKAVVDLTAGETAYFYGYCNGNATVTINTYEIATEDSIEAIVPTGEKLSNHGADIYVKLSVTPETATAGYSCEAELSTSPDFEDGLGGWNYGSNAQYHSEELFLGNCYSLVPGTTYYLRASLKDGDWNEIASSGTVSFTTPDNRDGMETLAMGSNTISSSNYRYYGYFTAAEDGYYKFTAGGNFSWQLIDASGKNQNYYGEESVVLNLVAGETAYFYADCYQTSTVTISTYEVATENSIEAVIPSGDDLGNHSATFRVKLSVTPETAAEGYYYGVEVSTDPTFEESLISDGRSDNRMYNSEILTANDSTTLVPGVKYYLRAYLHNDYGDEIATSDTVSFTTPNNQDGMAALSLDEIYTPDDTYTRFYSYFTAEEDGFYAISAEEEFSGYVDIWGSDGNLAGSVYGDGDKAVVQLSGGDTVYAYGSSYSETGCIIVSGYIPATENYVEAMVPTDGQISNMSADIYALLSVTPETAAAGYYYSALISTDPGFAEDDICWGSGRSDQSAYNEEICLVGNCYGLVPGATYYLRVQLLDSSRKNVLAVSDTVTFTTVDSRVGMEELILDSSYVPGPIFVSSLQSYFTAPADNLYAVTVDGYYGDLYDARGKLISYLNQYRPMATVRLNAGESIFFYGYMEAQNGSVTVTVQPTATENSIRITPPSGDRLGNTSASFDFTISVVPELAEQGYNLSFMISTDTKFTRENSSTVFRRSGTTAYYETALSAGCETLVPGVTYYLKGVLSKMSGEETVYESDVVSFTTVASQDNPTKIKDIMLDVPATFETGGLNCFRFTAPQDACYMLTGGYRGLMGENGARLNGFNMKQGVFFHLGAGEKAYLYTNGSQGSTVKVSLADTVLRALTVGTTDAGTYIGFRFTAPESRMYTIQISDAPSNAFLLVYNPEIDGWMGNEGGAYTATVQKGQTIYVVVAQDGPASDPDTSTFKITVSASDPVVEYVKRNYRLILGREGDQGGINYWVNLLKSGQAGGANIVSEFVRSKEFVNNNYSSTDAVTIVYRTMLGREPDAGGMNYWKEIMDGGSSCNLIVRGFSGQPEFLAICQSYGIKNGSVGIYENRDRNTNLTKFVSRNYQYALERKGDANGLNYWTGQILSKASTPQQCAFNFVFSAECVNRNLNNTAFLEMLYHLYMGRDADQGGVNYWLGQMSKGMSRQAVANSFAGSKEFTEIVKSYGL